MDKSISKDVLSRELLSLKECALSKKDWDIYIYEAKDKNDVTSWKLLHTLNNWHPETNRIISGSYDRNIFIWNLKDGKWIPDLVVFSQKGSILDVKWSVRGDKFSVGTGSKLVSTGYFEDEVNWWTCKSMKEHKSAVTSARFDNSGLFIVSGSTDLRAYISSSYLPFIDDKYQYSNLPFEKQNHGEVLLKISLDSWVNDVCWSPSCKTVVVSAQDSTLTFVHTEDQSTTTLNLESSPITKIAFINDTSFVAVAFDRHVYLFELTDKKNWVMKKDFHGVEKVETQVQDKPIDTSNMSVQDRIKSLSGGKRGSTMLTNASLVPKNLHASNINSANISDGNLITSDYTGFIKMLKIK